MDAEADGEVGGSDFMVGFDFVVGDDRISLSFPGARWMGKSSLIFSHTFLWHAF